MRSNLEADQELGSPEVSNGDESREHERTLLAEERGKENL
jgi:hypothetical protein